ncbi:MAG: YlxR family protein, partial [Anaerolineales bacterium]|nr:YlxR family protein [Anaerolineales bacterium]
PEGVQIDPTGKLTGRGAYLHNRRFCWARGLKGPLAHALKMNLTPAEIEHLREFSLTLPEDAEEAGAG